MEAQLLSGFNVRVYAVCVKNGSLLTMVEPFIGKMVRKLPGGGLEFGEGPVDCLHREFMEELNVRIHVRSSFFIQEHFVPSLVKDNKQILMLYFLVDIINWEEHDIMDPVIQKAEWVPLTKDCPLSLPVDKLMYEKLLTQFS